MDFINGIGQVLDPLRLKLLTEVHRRGSISAASEACQISQPSASKHLRKLEHALGQRLVERNGRASSLTPAGVLVAQHANRVLGVLAAMDDDLRALSAGDRGTLSIAACPTTGTYVLPDLLTCFADRYPGVEVRVEIAPSAVAAQRVSLHEVQIGMCGEHDICGGIAAERVLEDHLVGISAPGQLDLTSGFASETTISTQTLLIREQGSSARYLSERHLADAGLNFNRIWELGSNEAIKRAVRAGLGVGFISSLAVQDDVDRGELVEFRLEGIGLMPRSIWLLRPDDRPPTPSEIAFAATLAECCAVEPAVTDLSVDQVACC